MQKFLSSLFLRNHDNQTHSHHPHPLAIAPNAPSFPPSRRTEERSMEAGPRNSSDCRYGVAAAERRPTRSWRSTERADYAEKRCTTLAITTGQSVSAGEHGWYRHTMKGDNAEDEDDGEGHDDDGVDLEARGFIGVEPWCAVSSAHCKSTSEMSAPSSL